LSVSGAFGSGKIDSSIAEYHFQLRQWCRTWRRVHWERNLNLAITIASDCCLEKANGCGRGW
jgi:hypothetical protein